MDATERPSVAENFLAAKDRKEHKEGRQTCFSFALLSSLFVLKGYLIDNITVIRHIRRIMNISNAMTDEVILHEVGERLARIRLDRNLTQAELADQAGVSKRTVERMESGEVATQLSGLVRVCRALQLIEGFNALIPEPVPSPMSRLKMRGKLRLRATGTRASTKTSKKWTWKDK